jgi:hypothetical protein
VPYKQLTAENLATAINKALEPSTIENAEQIGKEIRMENGTQNAVRSFHKHLDLQSLRCSICHNQLAVWWLRNSHIKLSAFAASVLVHTGHLKPHDLVLYVSPFVLQSYPNCARYRAQEYDTNRDPRGPLSAGAGVFYGLATDVIRGIANSP